MPCINMKIDIKELSHKTLVMLCDEQNKKLMALRQRRTEAARRYRKKHPEVCVAASRRYYFKNREQILQNAADRRAVDRGKKVKGGGQLEPPEPPLGGGQ